MPSYFNWTDSMSWRRKKRGPVTKRLQSCMKPVLHLFRASSHAWKNKHRTWFRGRKGLEDFPVQGGFHTMQLDKRSRRGFLISPFATMAFDPQIRPAGSVKNLIENRKYTMDNSNGFRPSPSVYHRSLFLENGKFLEISDVPLGRGGFGSVFVGRLTDPSGESTMVAVKNSEGLAFVGSESPLTEEKRIYDLLALDQHPNIVKSYGCSTAQDVRDSLIVLEYIPNTLYNLIVEDPEFNSYTHVLKVLHGIASALEHLHEHNIIHFDLKPQNVLVTEDLQAKVTDFGMSKFWLNRPITVTPRGTLPYMAPECRPDDRPGSTSVTLPRELESISATDAVDIFSFGMLALACVTGDIQMEGSVAEQMIADGKFVKVGGFEVTKEPCDCPKELRKLISDCLQFNPDALDNSIHGRPSASDLKKHLQSMQTRPWADDQLTWID